MGSRWCALWVFAVAWPCSASRSTCPGEFSVRGYGSVSLVPTGWKTTKGPKETVVHGTQIVPHMDSRAYFADHCTPGAYDRHQYMASDLRGKKIKYTVDLSGAGCGCNAAFYLTSMRQNERPSECHDYYCDANNVCGESCTEIDIQEANQYAWHSTLHASTDHSGEGAGYGGGKKGWNGPRDWTAAQYGPGAKCIDTKAPFEVVVSFPVDFEGSLLAMEVTLSQKGHSCPLSVKLDKYKGMQELSSALEAGMTPIVSYWSDDDMLWLDGKGADGKGSCARDHAAACGDSVSFSGFSIESLPHPKKPHTKEAALSEAEEAQKNGGKVIVLSAPDGYNLPGVLGDSGEAQVFLPGEHHKPLDVKVVAVEEPGPAADQEPKPTASSSCREAFQQCGGKTWAGATCCAQGCACEATKGGFYSQCVPHGGSSTCAAAAALEVVVDEVAEQHSTTKASAHWMFIRRDAPGPLRGKPTPSAAAARGSGASPDPVGSSMATTAAVLAGMAVLGSLSTAILATRQRQRLGAIAAAFGRRLGIALPGATGSGQVMIRYQPMEA